MQNWAGNVVFNAADVARPSSVAEVQQLVTTSSRVRVLGTGHSFSPVADTTGLLVSLAGLPAVVEIDSAKAQARVSAGLRYGDIARPIDAAGLALANLASLPHLTVAGAVSTGTHGSGVGNPGLSAAVAAVELVTASGDIVEIGRGDAGFGGAVVALGCLGVVVSLTLDLVPTFQVRQVVYDAMPYDALTANLVDVLGRAYSVSLFTRWRGDAVDQVWVKERVADDADSGKLPAEWYGARLATSPRHMIEGAPTERCTEQLGVPGPWYDRLPHFRLDDTPSSGDELQSEYLVPAEVAVAALDAIRGVADVVAPVLQVSEIRTVAADEQWLSPAYQQDSVALHFTWIRDVERVMPAVRAVEAALVGLDARPHWGKVFDMAPADVEARYERLGDFAAHASALDPGGRFRNNFVDGYVFRGHR